MSQVIPVARVEDTLLYKELLKRDNIHSFIANIPTLCEEASSRATQIPRFFAEYTLHDKTHFLRVTEIMASVLGDTLEQLHSLEIGLLILAAFYHDQGMVVSSEEYNKLENDEAFVMFRGDWRNDHPNYGEVQKQHDASFISDKEKERLQKLLNELDGAMLTDYLRETHGKRSHDYVLTTLSNDRRVEIFGVNISNYLAKICWSHVQSVDWINEGNGFRYDESIGTATINTVFLALMLRLADILDFDSDRTPDVLFKSIHFTSPVSIVEWQKHRSVRGWKITKDIVQFTMDFEHPVYEKTARTFIDWIEEELHQCHTAIRKFPSSVSKYQLGIAEKVDRTRLGAKNNAYLYHDLEFTLSRDEVVKLLMTDKLYQKSSLFIRELLQNSLDALRLRKAQFALEDTEWNAGKVSFRHYIDDEGQEVVECCDNGCGMDEHIISKYLGKVGRSFYRSPEFNRERTKLKDKGVDFEPCSQFGIGFMSCFMIGDRIRILTRKDYGVGKERGKPLEIEINGIGGLITIKEGNPKQEIGTTIKVFVRKRQLILHEFSDKIRLLPTLEGYALAAEFPIEAECSLDRIQSSITIPTSIARQTTFLEKCGIKSIQPYEIDVSTVHKDLRGFLRQTFLVDEHGLPCTENEEAKWEVQIDDKNSSRINAVLFIKLTNQKAEYHVSFAQHDYFSICFDGILICGSSGGRELHKLDYFITPIIYSEHPGTIDVRGQIKPEIKPNRTPPERSFSLPISWKLFNNQVAIARGLIWQQVLELSQRGLEAEAFWKLVLIYNGNINYIKSSVLLKYLCLPVNGNEWIKLSEIRSFSFDDTFVTAKDYSGELHTLEFSAEIMKIGKAQNDNINFNHILSNYLLPLSKFVLTNSQTELVIRTDFNEEEVPDDNVITSTYSHQRFIPFAGLENSFIITTQYGGIANNKHPIVKVIQQSQYIQEKDALQEFANSLVFSFLSWIHNAYVKQEPFQVDLRIDYYEYLGILFTNINWNKYSPDLKPPYKIYVDENEAIEITEENLRNWARRQQP